MVRLLLDGQNLPCRQRDFRRKRIWRSRDAAKMGMAITIMKHSKKILLASLGLAMATATSALAGNILIVNGSVGTSEPTTTANITSNLDTLHNAAGNTVTVSSSIPGDLTPYDQVWDIRFSNAFAMSAAERANYVAFMAAGGGMFVMGENSGFTARNNSVLALIDEAGGGNLGFVTPAATQIVVAPFDGPNAVTQVTYLAPGGVGLNAPGTGQFITKEAAADQGTGVAFGVGDLAAAPAGALTVIFDVNFMENRLSHPEAQLLTKNLIQFVGDQVDPPPVPDGGSTLALLGLALAGLVMHKRRA